MRYLEKKNRAVARDFINCLPEDLDPYGRTWADQMDRTRARAGNDRPVGGKKARTYGHFVLSPDPQDKVELETLRSLAVKWTEENFNSGDCHFQCAIIYHTDSDVHHAHVVVNNTDLTDRRRLAPKLTKAKLKEMYASMDRLCAEHGLHTFPESVEKLEEEQYEIEKHNLYAPATEREIHEQEEVLAADSMYMQGKYSWKEDIEQRVAKSLKSASDIKDFFERCKSAGIEILETKRGEYLYVLADQPSRKVGASRLEGALTKAGVAKHFGLGLSKVNVAPKSLGTVQRNYRSHTERALSSTSNYSWKEDIKERVRLAKDISFTMGEFEVVLNHTGIDTRINKQGEYVYSFADKPTQQVGATRLGTEYSRYNIMVELSEKGLYIPPRAETLAAISKFTDDLITGSKTQVIGYLDPKSGMTLGDLCKSVGLIVDYEISHTGEIIAMSEVGEKYKDKSIEAQQLAESLNTALVAAKTYDLLGKVPADFDLPQEKLKTAVAFRLKIDSANRARSLAVKNVTAAKERIQRGNSEMTKVVGRAGFDYAQESSSHNIRNPEQDSKAHGSYSDRSEL